MTNLMMTTATEIGWHGTIIREDSVYTVTDIFMYPQIVTAATVETDEADYVKWCMELPDDVINSLRFHGHSHVNMAVNPSGIDNTFYGKLLQQIPEDDFYIFMIRNKLGSVNVWLYDLATNCLYDSADIDIEVELDAETSLAEWTRDQKTEFITLPPVKTFGATQPNTGTTTLTDPPKIKRTGTETGEYRYNKKTKRDEWHPYTTKEMLDKEIEALNNQMKGYTEEEYEAHYGRRCYT